MTAPPPTPPPQGDWLEGSWERVGLEDEGDGELFVVLIVGDEAGEVPFVVKWDDGEQGVAG